MSVRSRSLLTLLAIATVACTSSPDVRDAGAMDAHAASPDAAREMDAGADAIDAWVCDDWVIWGCPPPPPPQPAHFDPPTLGCGASVDAGASDPCSAWFDCVPSDVDAGDPWAAWGVLWSGGSCVAGTCVFTTDPSVQYCYGGCSLHTGMYGRCTHVGPTAP